mgnify:CR=1 FL=1
MKHVKLTKISAVENPEYKTPSFDEYDRKKDTNERMSLPVEYTVEGYLTEDVEVGKHVVIQRTKRNGLKCFGIMTTSLVRRQALNTELGRLERMLEIRAVEESIQTLYNDGHVRGSTHLANGQEAVSVGIASVLRPTDVVTCTYRGHAAALALGVSPEGVLGEICGRVIGCSGGMGGSMHLMDASVGLMPTFAIVGAGLPVAAGVALAAKLKKNDSVALTIFGDGSTNIGAFHETLNMASIFKLPIIFVIENNLYGEYTRINLSTPISDLADRADSYAMRKEIVDGQDIDAVIKSISAAVDFARAGNGPSLIEAKTYRFSGHSRADPAT